MPELPEVETVRRQVQAALAGRRFSSVEAVEPSMLRDAEPGQLPAVLPGRTVLAVDRVGKFMVMPLSGDWFLTVHLGMTGQLLVMEDGEVTGGAGAPPYRSLDPVSPHDRFVFRLDPQEDRSPDGSPGAATGTRLVFRDIRKFGRLHLTPGGPAERLLLLGPDAWRGEWTARDLARQLRGRTAPLKAFLLDQRHLAGIGNIYADEILFAAALAPVRPAGSLTGEEVERLATEIRARLDEGVRLRGCSLSDFVDTKGRTGSFQDALKAYGRQGQACARCGATLVRIVIGGRGTAYCQACQH
jgi:formamidopyrimidine-DNA glycosylase